MPDTCQWITNICDADLRRTLGFAEEAESLTIEDAINLSAEYEKRKAAVQGDSSKNQNK